MQPLFLRRRDPFWYSRPPFLRHLHNLAISGFYARELDADDHDFLEYVKVRGIANGTLPNTSIVSLEELEFWHGPYSDAPDVEVRHGPVPTRVRPLLSPEQQAFKQARTNIWHARRIIRKEERAIADAELEREQKEWEAANERRTLRNLVADSEWEAADPSKRKELATKATERERKIWLKANGVLKKPAKLFGKIVNRHYIPQWKVEEQFKQEFKQELIRLAPHKRAKEVKRIKLAGNLAALAKHEAAKAKRERAERESSIFRPAPELVDFVRQQAEREHAATQQRLAEAAQRRADEQAARQTLIDEAQKTIERMSVVYAPPAISAYPNVNSLKQAIRNLIRGTYPHVWTLEDFMRALPCDRAMLDAALLELMADGQLRKTDSELSSNTDVVSRW